MHQIFCRYFFAGKRGDFNHSGVLVYQRLIVFSKPDLFIPVLGFLVYIQGEDKDGSPFYNRNSSNFG